jgi:hypothetical protein
MSGVGKRKLHQNTVGPDLSSFLTKIKNRNKNPKIIPAYYFLRFTLIFFYTESRYFTAYSYLERKRTFIISKIELLNSLTDLFFSCKTMQH